jgi:hypothetical protein
MCVWRRSYVAAEIAGVYGLLCWSDVRDELSCGNPGKAWRTEAGLLNCFVTTFTLHQGIYATEDFLSQG